MARFGIFCFASTGHLNPMIALADAFYRRGHEILIFGIADVEAQVRAAGIEFRQIGIEEFPLGSLRYLNEQLAELNGLAALRLTLRWVRRSMQMVLRNGPAAVQASKVDALLVDEADFAGNVADSLGLPWISIALFPPLLHDDRFPPFWFGWTAGQDRLSRLRNRVAMSLLLRVAAPIFKEVNQQRVAWGLAPHPHPRNALSPWGQITQLPEVLQFEVGGDKPVGVRYHGPFVKASLRPALDFPWERLDGRPLVYASLGTLQNGSEATFRSIARACAGLNVQLILSLGGGLDPAVLGRLAGDPIVVRFAPQLEILKKTMLVITHAGLNTVLEALCEGVPMVAMPLANDQPGVAARLKARGACVVVSRHFPSVRKLRKAIRLVLKDARYRRAAQVLQKSIGQADWSDLACQSIETALGFN